MAFDAMDALAVAQYVEHADVTGRRAVARRVLAEALSAELDVIDDIEWGDVGPSSPR